MANAEGTQGTPKKEAKWHALFLTALGNSGCVLAACRTARIVRRTAYKHRDKFPVFRAAWDGALEDAVDLLEAEAIRRAAKGVEKPVYYQGKIVGYIKEYSDSLLMFLIKGNRPKYRDGKTEEPQAKATVPSELRDKIETAYREQADAANRAR